MFTGLEGSHGARARCSLKGSPRSRPHGRHQDWWGDRHHRDKRRPPMHFEHASPERDLLQTPRVQEPLKEPHTDSGRHRVKRAGRREPETSSDSWSHRTHTHTHAQAFKLPGNSCFRGLGCCQATEATRRWDHMGFPGRPRSPPLRSEPLRSYRVGAFLRLK